MPRSAVTSIIKTRWVNNEFNNEYIQTLGAEMTIKNDLSG
jgi:hypothetical protein